MNEIDDHLRQLAERGEVRGAEAVFDEAAANPARPGIRSTRALVLVAVVVIAVLSVTTGLLVRDDAPRSLTADVPPFVDGTLPFATDTVLVFDDGLEGIVAVDVDGQRVARHALDGQRAGDQPYRLHRTGDALVYGWGEVFASSLTGTDVRSLGDATIFVPALEEGSVWLVDYGRRIGDAIPTLRRVSVDGAVLEESPGLQQENATPVREVAGGMAYQTDDGLVVWDPDSGETTTPLPAGAALGDAHGTLVAWCDDAGPCRSLHITDLERGEDVTVAPSDDAYAVDVNGARFSPDGGELAVQAGPEILLVDTVTGDRRVAVPDALPDAGRLTWAEDGRRLFFSTVSYGTGMMVLGAHELDTDKTGSRLLPFGGTLGVVALPDTIGLRLFDTDARRFEPCAVDAGSCPTTTTTTTTPSSPPTS